MKEKIKNQKGIGLIAIIFIVIIAILIIGVGALTVRMIVTGEEFLAPIEEFFSAEDTEDDDKEDKVIDKKDNEDEEDKDINKKDNKDEEDKTDDSKDEVEGAIHYHGEIDFNDYTGGSSLEYSDLIKMNADFYATETEIIEIIFEFNLKAFLEKYYEAYEDDMVAAGYATYESFRDEMMTTFETSFSSGFATSGSEVEDYFEIDYPEEEIMEMHITEDGITQMYENYGLKEGDSVQEILDGFEKALNIELKEV